MNQIIVTVLGMLAAFATAFLAEPVKIYFQNKAKLRDLRVALYKEMWENFSSSNLILYGGIRIEGKLIMSDHVNIFGGNFQRTEYYQQTLKNDLSLYYQLKESGTIHLFYTVLSLLKKGMPETQDKKLRTDLLMESARAIHNLFLGFVQADQLDKKIYKHILNDEEYRILLLAEKDERKLSFVEL